MIKTYTTTNSITRKDQIKNTLYEISDDFNDCFANITSELANKLPLTTLMSAKTTPTRW